MDSKKYYERQISLSEWFEKLDYKEKTEFREEDNWKRDRLAFLKTEIGVPFDEPVKFKATDLSKNTPNFKKYFKKHSEEYCALRLIPKDPQFPKLRMRGLIIRKAYDWFKDQDINPEKYQAEFIPHSERPLWSTIFVVNKNGIFGEAIRGMLNQLSQGYYDNNKPFLFSFDFNKLSLSKYNKDAEEELRKIINHIHVKDNNKRRNIKKEFHVNFYKNYLQGYFETISTEEYGLWFTDFNRILGNIYKDFSLKVEKLQKKKVKTKIIQGRSASGGVVKGKARIINENNVNTRKMDSGDVLVCEMTNPEYIVHLKKASAIVTDKGGILCHAAIVAREFGIPCIVGTNNATGMIHEGNMIEVDADHGFVKILD